MMTQERIFIVVGAVVAVLLQLMLAPYIAVFSAIPNFVAAFTMVVAVTRAHSFGPVLPFVMGLVFDLAGGGPVGAMAFSLTLCSYLVARYTEHSGNDSPVMMLVFIAAGLLLVELIYGIVLLIGGYQAGLPEALAFRVGPCFLYDVVVAFIMYPIANRFAQPKGAVRTDITQLR